MYIFKEVLDDFLSFFLDIYLYLNEINNNTFSKTPCRCCGNMYIVLYMRTSTIKNSKITNMYSYNQKTLE